MRVDFKDAAIAGFSATNPVLGLAANALRHRAPTDGNLLWRESECGDTEHQTREGFFPILVNL